MNHRISIALLTLSLCFLIISCSTSDTTPPKVVRTFPENGSTDVDPLTNELSVIFDEEMMNENWSWVYENKNSFPTTTGQPYYDNNMTKNILPVKLEENKEYVIWINQPAFNNFKDKSGNSASPYKFTFKTKHFD